MADSFIQVPPDSTGKQLDTRTAPDGNHREVITVGSPTLADVAEADATNGLDVDVTRVQGTVAVSNAALTALAGAIAGTEVQVDIVSGGGSGTQYTEDAAAPADPIGTALAMVRDDVLSAQTSTDGDVVAARGTDKGELYVKHVDAIPITDNAGSLTVDGTVAVTNADMAAAAASLAVIDDWDESDRAKTNPIVGQAGVQGGSGVITALTQRVVLATDQPTVPVSLAAGGTTQYAEDSAHSSGDQVTLAGVVQQSADAALSTDGDRSLLQVDSSGFLKVNVKAGAGGGGTAMADDDVFTPAVTQGTPAFGLADETAPDSVDEGDAGALRMTLDRKLLTRIVGAADANRLDIDGSGHAQIDIAAASVTVPVSAVALPLPTGAATEAKQDTEITHLATIAGDTTDIETAVELIDDTVAVLGTDVYTEATTKGLVVGAVRRDADTTLVGTTNEISPLQVDALGRLKVEAFSGETLPTSIVSLPNEGQQTMASSISVAVASNQSTLPVDVVVALPAGTNNIGDVDVLSVIPGTAATNLGKAIDSAPGATDTGVAALVVRDDALATLTPADGDYTVLRTDSTGALWTRSTSAAGGTSATDEDAFVAGTSTGTPLMGARDDTAPDTLAEDTIGIIRATTNRALHVNLRDAAGAELAVGGGTQYDEDTASTAADKLNMAGVVRKDTAATLVDTDGDRTQLQVDATGRLHVNGSGVTQPVSAASLPLPAGASTAALQTQPGVDIGDVTVNNAAGAAAVNIQDGGNVITVDGTVGVSGAVDTELPAAAALADNTANPTVPAVGSFLMAFDGTNWDRVQTGAAATGSLKVDGSAVTQPVSAGSLPLPTGASTLAEQQSQTTHLATIAGDTTDIEAAVELIDDTVQVLGTDVYTEATSKGLTIGAVRRDADTTLVGTTNEFGPLQMDANGRLKVEAFSGETLPVSAASLPLPTGASTLAEQQTQTTHLATIAGDTTAIETAVQIMDDWDESDRAKVNPIAGQAGVQGASGVVTALTQRVVLATDVGLPAGTSNIGDVDVLTLPALVAGSANIGDVDIASVAAGTVMEVVGDVAADVAVPANPVAIGGRASTAVPTAMSADGDSVFAWLNRNGLQVVSAIPGAGLNADPYTLLSESAQYTTTQTSAIFVAGGASERIVVTSVQIQVGGTTAGTLQVYFGTGAYVRGTDEAIFDGEFAPSATSKPGIFMAPPGGFRAGALGDDILVTTSAAINPLTITIWYYLLGV